MRPFFARTQTVGRRWLSRLIISLALAVVVVGAFWLGMLIGETRGGAPPVFGQAGIEHPWPFGDWSGQREHHGGHGAFGVVNQIGADALVITDHGNNRRQIIITAETLFKRGREPITLAEVRVGDRVGVIGQPREEKIEAKIIWVIHEDHSHN
ncbi:MAG: hypothetical protein KJ077_01790 [Anaerolineae bacterium]|nr:hypothetical protein [Anaerolineae bacterium]